MGTRTVLFVTGNRPHADTGQQTIRLYEHWNGDPTTQLAVIRNAIKKADRLLTVYQQWKPEAQAIPASGFADCLISETLGVHGFAARIDTDHDVNAKGTGTLAIFPEALSPKHYGDQGDLEWVYVVEVNARTLRIYHADDNTPAEHIAHGMVDPRLYADELIPEAQREHRRVIGRLVRSIQALGWHVNPSETNSQERRLTRPAGRASGHKSNTPST